MPKTLHAELAARADADGVSLNQYIVSALSRAVSGSAEPDRAPAPGETPRPLPRSVRVALGANAVVVALAAVVAVVVLVFGFR